MLQLHGYSRPKESLNSGLGVRLRDPCKYKPMSLYYMQELAIAQKERDTLIWD